MSLYMSGLRTVGVVVLVTASVVGVGGVRDSCDAATDSVGHISCVSEGAGTPDVVVRVIPMDVVGKKAGGNKPGGGLRGVCAGVGLVGGCSDVDVCMGEVSGEY
jgi:hypothetical protein